MASSPTDVSPNTPTFSFHKTTYTSPYLVFKSFEAEDRNTAPLQTMPPRELALFNKYNAQTDASRFMDMGNKAFILDRL